MNKNLIDLPLTVYIFDLPLTVYIFEKEKCGKGDLNSRTPTRMDSKSTALDQTWQFPLLKFK